MKSIIVRLLPVFIVFIVCSCCNLILKPCSEKQMVNPLQYGLKEAESGEERYQVLLRTHKEALRLGVGVSYAGIKRIDLTIPENAKSIPLTKNTDFAGVTITVENKQKSLSLFVLANKLNPVSVEGKEIDNHDFSHNPILKTGNKLLVIYDKTLWVEERIGYGKGTERKDIMLVRSGKGSNGPVQSYCTAMSNPDCYYCDVDVSEKNVIKNLTFNRTNTSTEKTYLVKIENQYNVEISNVTINTPDETGLTGDRAIYIVNCAKVVIKDVVVNCTYSLPRQAGYGVSIHNIYDLYVENMYARANWGVFGNHNVNKAYLKNCDINRFDNHCYGRDVRFDNCNFVDLYNQFSGMYGEIRFDKCTFTNCHPVLIEGTYNAFTPFDLYFQECTFNFDKKHPGVVYFSSFSNETNSRPELRDKCLPNVTILNCRVNMVDDLKQWYVFNIKKAKDYKGKFSYISKVRVEGLNMDNRQTEMEQFSNQVETVNKVELTKSLKK